MHRCVTKSNDKNIIIHPMLLYNQSAPVTRAPVTPDDLKIKSHIRSVARHDNVDMYNLVFLEL